ncbi:Ger(x)C family spore germination protein [Brevibacillus fluminis]|uniref:Ger(x)C family spore germination protein n=1 Tax=Brevibacillus fluminis TaxID=511487 RepID=UPI003F8C9AD4
MKRWLRMAFLLTLLAPVLCGCWDMKSIQFSNYITALGFDYRDGHYVVYGQVLDFSNIAKQEGGKMSETAAPVWTGHEEGDTVNTALTNLYKTSQQRIYWGHTNAIVFTEAALAKGMSDFLDGLTRFGETRLTQWVYGTKEPLDQLFTVTPFFNLSPLASILHQPEDSYRQDSYIRPIRLYKVLAQQKEPGYTILLPSLHINAHTWKRQGEADTKLELDGIFALYQDKLGKWIAKSHVSGLRWLQKGSTSSHLTLKKNGKPIAVITVEHVKGHIKPVNKPGAPRFTITIKGKAVVSEVIQELGAAAFQEEAAKDIREAIEQTVLLGKKDGVDLLSLEHTLYHDAFAQWSKLTANGKKRLADYALDTIEVDVKIVNSGMLRDKEEPKREY